MIEEEFWKYWKLRWPHASCDESVIGGSANYQETRKAFFAGYKSSLTKQSEKEEGKAAIPPKE